jgi:hypothetical protein
LRLTLELMNLLKEEKMDANPISKLATVCLSGKINPRGERI